MDIQKLTIGQMAELNQVTRQTLRYYEAEGLLVPYYTEPGSGYRYYHINQSAKLDMWSLITQSRAADTGITTSIKVPNWI